MLSNPLTIQRRGNIFFHPKPLKSACQWRGSTRPPHTTARKYHRRMEDDNAGKGERRWALAGVRPQRL
jgi:hypothetical protein